MRDMESGVKSPFNMALATLERIDTLLKLLNDNYITGNIIIMQRSAYSLYAEVYPFLNDKEKTIAKSLWDQCKDNIITNDMEEIKITFKAGTIESIKTFEFWLREKLHDHGLLMAKPDSPDLAIGQ